MSGQTPPLWMFVQMFKSTCLRVGRLPTGWPGTAARKSTSPSSSSSIHLFFLLLLTSAKPALMCVQAVQQASLFWMWPHKGHRVTGVNSFHWSEHSWRVSASHRKDSGEAAEVVQEAAALRQHGSVADLSHTCWVVTVANRSNLLLQVTTEVESLHLCCISGLAKKKKCLETVVCNTLPASVGSTNSLPTLAK